MSANHGPNIVTDGLVLYLDAANTKSYPTTGTTWSDLSGYRGNGTLTNGPTFNTSNSGSLVFDGIDDYINGSLTNLPTGSSNRTIGAWFKTSKAMLTNQYQIIFWYGNAATNQGIFSLVGGDANISVGAKARFGASQYGNLVGSPQEVNDGNWKNGVIVIESSVYTIYLNGVSVASKTMTTNTANTIYTVGVGTGVYFQGNIANVNVYNRALTAAEVLQNYNASKSRFGL